MGLFNSQKKELTPIFYIGSDKISAALVHFAPHELPEILYSSTSELPVQETIDLSRLETALFSAFKTTVEDLFKQAAKKYPNSVLTQSACLISSPWYLSQTKILTTGYPKPTPIKEAAVEAILRQEIARFEHEIADQSHRELTVLEKKILGFTLNQYQTANPYDKKATELGISLYLSFTFKDFKEKIDGMLEAASNRSALVWHSTPLISFGALRSSFAAPKDFVIIEVVGEMTEISIVRDSLIEQSISFPYGTSSLIRDTAELLHTTAPVALSLFGLHYQSTGEQAVDERIEPLIKKKQKGWEELFSQAVSTVESASLLPTRMYLSCQKEIAPFFKQAIESEEYAQIAMAASAYEVILLNDLPLADHYKSELKEKIDQSLILSTVFLAGLLRETE